MRVKPETTITTAQNTPSEDKHSFNWGWIAWPLVVLFLYGLSSGPYVMMVERQIHNDNSWLLKGRVDKIANTFYAPLGWVYESTFLHKPVGMYLHLWAPNLIGKDGNVIYE